MNHSRVLPQRKSPSQNRLQGIESRGASRSTERKRPNMAQCIARLDWLSSSILHDLRNPVATIYASTEMLMNSDAGPSEIKRLAANMHSAAARMRKLLTEVAISGNKSAPELCDISEVITAAAEAASASTEHRSVRVSLDVHRGIEVPLARSRIERAFFNLIINAFEAMPGGGEVRICARQARAYAVVEIEDTGPGIPNEIRKRIFHPFVTARKANGLGLGLSLSRQAILDHGGDLWIETAPGARFVMRFPLNRVQVETNCILSSDQSEWQTNVKTGLDRSRGQSDRSQDISTASH
jgi:signal transduction histidine kinase